MPILVTRDQVVNQKPELHTHTAYCHTCQKLIYSTGQHIAGSSVDIVALERTERLASGHADYNRGHRTQVFLDSVNVAGRAWVFLDEGVRA